jgi:hypothetical protein
MLTAQEVLNTPITAKEVLAIGKAIGRFGAMKCGTTLAGGIRCFSFVNWRSEKSWFVVPSDAFYKFGGSAQKAAIYGKENIDFFEYKTPADAAKKITKLVHEIAAKQLAHEKQMKEKKM